MPNKILSNITSVYTDKSINGWLRGIIWVGTIAIVYVGGKAIYSKLFPSSDTIRIQQEQAQFSNDLSTSISTNPPSFQTTQFNEWADEIATSLQGTIYSDLLIWSVPFTTINKIFGQLKSNTDYLMLIKSFGLRDISGGLLSANLNQVDLPTAIGKKLNDVEINGSYVPFSPSLNDTLHQQGITYTISKL